MPDRFTPSVIMCAVLLVGGAWLAIEQSHVAAQVERVTIEVKLLKDSVAADHERQVRTEAQLEYVAKLALMQLNDDRAAAGRPLVPDEFPRSE